MQIRKSIAAMVALVVLLISVQAVTAGEQDFQLYNRTGVDIYALYVSPSGVDDWEEDILGADILLAGADIPITFDREEDDALWDLRVEDSEGNYLEYEEINLLSVYEVILEQDGVARCKE